MSGMTLMGPLSAGQTGLLVVDSSTGSLIVKQIR